MSLIAYYPKTLLASLSEQLDADSWNLLSAQLIGALSDMKKQRTLSAQAQAELKDVKETTRVSVAC